MPDVAGRAPLLIVIHGGFWRVHFDRRHAEPLAAALAGLGYAVASIEFRRVGQEGGGWPGTVDDVALATERLPALVAGAAPGRTDSHRIVLAGHSAGGHLAMWAAGSGRPGGFASPTDRDVAPCHNLRVQAWLANVEACIGNTERARARVKWLLEAEPHNGYLKYRIAHVLAELGDTSAGVRILHEAVQDGFLSVQILKCDELLGLSRIVYLVKYGKVKNILQRNVKQAKKKYAPSTVFQRHFKQG